MDEEEEEEAIEVARRADEKELELARAMASKSEDEGGGLRSPMNISTLPSPDKYHQQQSPRKQKFESLSTD